MSGTKFYDLIVIGGGAMGLATAYHASKSQNVSNVLVLEQYAFYNELSSSGGSSRQFRLQYEEDYMAKLVLAAIPYWDELQAHTDITLRTKVGSLWFGAADVQSSEGQINAARNVLDQLNLPYQNLCAAEIENEFHFTNLPDSYGGFFQPDGGSLNTPAILRTLYQQAAASKRVTLSPQQKVIELIAGEHEIVVRTTADTFTAKKLVIAAGPFTNEILKLLGIELNIIIWQMVSCYFKKKHAGVDFPSWFVFEEPKEYYDPGLYYGFEEMSWSNPGFIRIAPAFALHTFRDPADRTDRPDAMDVWRTAQWVQNHMPELEAEARFKSWCMAALPAHNAKKMFLDFAPNAIPSHRNIVIFSAGWAFKFVPLIGKICADLAIAGKTSVDISKFGIEEFYERPCDLD